MKTRTAALLFCISTVTLIPIFINQFINESYSNCIILSILYVLAIRGLQQVVIENKEEDHHQEEQHNI